MDTGGWVPTNPLPPPPAPVCAQRCKCRPRPPRDLCEQRDLPWSPFLPENHALESVHSFPWASPPRPSVPPAAPSSGSPSALPSCPSTPPTLPQAPRPTPGLSQHLGQICNPTTFPGPLQLPSAPRLPPRCPLPIRITCHLPARLPTPGLRPHVPLTWSLLRCPLHARCTSACSSQVTPSWKSACATPLPLKWDSVPCLNSPWPSQVVAIRAPHSSHVRSALGPLLP